MALRRVKQSRWTGDIATIVSLTEEAADLVRERSGQEPVVLATIQLPKEDEDHRLGLDDIRRGLTGLDAKQIARIKGVLLRINSAQRSDVTISISKGDDDSVQIDLDGADAASVAELRSQLDQSGGLDRGTVQQVGETVGQAVAGLLRTDRPRSAASNLGISIRLSRIAPGIQAEVVGDDDLVVRGARDSLLDALRDKRPRVGAPPFAVTYLIAYFITFMYGVAMGQFGVLDWVPDIAVIGPILFFVCLILPSAALGYLVFWLMNSVLLPPLALTPKNAPGSRTVMVRRAGIAVWAGVTALVPVVLQVIDAVTDGG